MSWPGVLAPEPTPASEAIDLIASLVGIWRKDRRLLRGSRALALVDVGAVDPAALSDVVDALAHLHPAGQEPPLARVLVERHGDDPLGHPGRASQLLTDEGRVRAATAILRGCRAAVDVAELLALALLPAGPELERRRHRLAHQLRPARSSE